MTLAAETRTAAPPERSHDRHDELVERLIGRLPDRAANAMRWLRKPSARWLRIPAGALLICGGVLSILPLLGIWMLPLGLLLLAEDAPPLRRLRNRALDYAHRRWPQWFAANS